MWRQRWWGQRQQCCGDNGNGNENGVSAALKPGFKDVLPTNDAIPLDKTKPDEV
jgi:hypothetical protein